MFNPILYIVPYAQQVYTSIVFASAENWGRKMRVNPSVRFVTKWEPLAWVIHRQKQDGGNKFERGVTKADFVINVMYAV